MWNQMSRWWCKRMHSKAMWPIHGHYICPDCHREYPVTWEVTPPAVEYRRQPQPRAEPAQTSWPARLFFQRAAGGLKRSDTM
jgi:hypothetical protein